MASPEIVVVKVGGSLYDIPDLGRHLLAYLRTLRARRLLLVPGGGRTAHVIREFDRLHHLGEAAAHDLALRVMTLNAHFLRRLFHDVGERVPIVATGSSELPGIALLDAHAFCAADSGEGSLLASWDATSDLTGRSEATHAARP